MSATIPIPHDRILNRAATQMDRIAAAPKPDGVKVDGRSLAQLLAFSARFGSLVRFVDLHDEFHGDWTDFFALDPTVANAVHAALDIRDIERELRRLMAEIHGAISEETCLRQLESLVKIIIKLLSILYRSWHHDTDIWRALGRFTAIDHRKGDSLAHPMNRIQEHLATRNPMLGFDGCWRRPERDWVKQFLLILEDAILGILEELRHGMKDAQAAVEASLKAPGHAPQAALYDAFAVLFSEARHEMNRFPHRFLDFYYGRILRQDSRAEKPAHLFLTFALAQGAQEADLPKGTLFPAGTDPSGQAIYYGADTSLDVTPAAITKLYVHRVIVDEQDDAPPVVTGVLSGVVANSADGSLPGGPFPLFGSETLGPVGALQMQPATIGFVIASSTLVLTGGTRTVSICLFPPEPATGETDQATIKALQDGIELYYTGPGAWVTVTGLTVDFGPQPGSFTLGFSLPADAPPMVALATAPAAEIKVASLPASAFPSPGQQPAILGMFQWQVGADGPQASGKADAFELLSHLQVDTASITVTVSGLSPAALSTSGGAIDPSQNFPVFGLVPAQNSDLRLSVPELFMKQPSSLSITIDWAGLPVTSSGFYGYYKGYQLDADGNRSLAPLFENDTFKVSLGVVSAGSWTLPDTQLPLFQTKPSPSGIAGAEGPLEPTSLLTAPSVSAVTPPAYYDPSSSLLTVTLAEPNYAFGNILYSANLTAAANANVGLLQKGAGGAGAAANAAGQVSAAATANAATADKSHPDTMKDAVGKAASALNGSTLSALQQAVAASGADPDTKSGWLKELECAVADKVKGSGLWTWLTGGKPPDAETIATRLNTWLQQHEQELSAHAGTLLQQARSALSAHGTLVSALKSAASQSVAAARTTLSAAFEQAQAALAQAGAPSVTPPAPMPNPPWQPMASAVTLSYGASVEVPVAPYAVPGELPLSLGGDQFYHLDLFDQISPTQVQSGSTVAILPHIDQRASLYIELSPPVPQISLLFILQAGPDGWSTEKPVLAWEQRDGLVWRQITVLADGTGNLLNSGIVTLQLLKGLPETGTARIRVRLISAIANPPYVKSITANAVTASWKGPGGAQELGVPLPAGTITSTETSIAGLGSVAQPEDSLGGIPPATGDSFDLWMAERLRHKGFAIDDWGYARQTLALVPMLWQAAVVPATDASTGAPAPGHVWVVAVGGPQTPNVSDPTKPMVNPEVLGEIRDLLSSVSNPFVTIGVTNPPYRRIRIVADLTFTDGDTVAANIEKLNADLIKWLSPWPAPELGYRPDDYYARHAVADFISRRSYVRGLSSLRIKPEKMRGQDVGWYYLTSARKHKLKGTQESAGTRGTAPA